MRTIKTFSTKGNQKGEITTDVTTWGGLRPLVEKAGYDVKNLHATESLTKHTLDHEDALLPVGDFILFLRPKKTKSGLDTDGLGFKELRQLVKDNDGAAEFLKKKYKKSYTNLSTADLRKGLKKFTSTVEETEEKATSMTNMAAATPDSFHTSLNAYDSVRLANLLLVDVCSKVEDEETCERIKAATAELASVATILIPDTVVAESVDVDAIIADAKEKEAKKLDAEETKNFQALAEALAKGFL